MSTAHSRRIEDARKAHEVKVRMGLAPVRNERAWCAQNLERMAALVKATDELLADADTLKNYIRGNWEQKGPSEVHPDHNSDEGVKGELDRPG